MKKIKQTGSPFVFSTDPNFKGYDGDKEEEVNFTEPAKQLIRVRLETKHRAGKAVTLVEQFLGSEEEKDKLGKQLKNYCGTGGSVKDGEILVQGDQRQKVLQWLHKNGYTKAKII